MRSGADGSTRIASSPAMRISWRRRRANSFASMPVCTFIAAARARAGSSSMDNLPGSVELLAMARREHAVAVQQQRRHAHELLDLGQRILVLVVAFILRTRRGEPGDVGERLAAFLRQRRFGAGRKAESAEEAAAPVEQRAAAFAQRRVGARQQQLEAEVAILELRHAGFAQAIE